MPWKLTAIILFLSISTSLAQEVEIVPCDITVFDGFTGKFKTPKPEGSYRVFNWELGGEDLQGNLVIECPHPAVLLANRKSIMLIEDSATVDLDSLSQVLELGVINFSLYSHKRTRSKLLEVNRHYESGRYQFAKSSSVVTRDRNGRSSFIDFFVVSAILILAFGAVLLNRFPKDTKDYAALSRSFSFKNREETLLTSRPFSRNNLVFIIFTSFLAGFVITSLMHLQSGTFNLVLLSDSYFLQWLQVSVLVFALISLKYVLILIFNNLYNLRDYKTIQFFNALRFDLGILVIGFVLLSFVFLSFRQPDLGFYNVLITMFLILLIVRALVLLLKLMNYSSHRILHLFSYLCATELIPFLVLYKTVLG